MKKDYGRAILMIKMLGFVGFDINIHYGITGCGIFKIKNWHTLKKLEKILIKNRSH